ncbi:MAG: hypothetical protein LC641_10840 [Spirochaeta sp.]|nr:hypothetical protein [Spirochaeta sp.]
MQKSKIKLEVLLLFAIGLSILFGCATAPEQAPSARASVIAPDAVWRVLILELEGETAAAASSTRAASTSSAALNSAAPSAVAEHLHRLALAAEVERVERYAGSTQLRDAIEVPQGGQPVQVLQNEDQLRALYDTFTGTENEVVIVFLKAQGLASGGLLITTDSGEDMRLSHPQLRSLLDKALGNSPAVVLVSADYSGGLLTAAPGTAGLFNSRRVIMTSAGSESTNFISDGGLVWEDLLARKLADTSTESTWLDIARTLEADIGSAEQSAGVAEFSQPQHWVPLGTSAELDAFFNSGT